MQTKTRSAMNEMQIAAIERKVWLGATDVSRLLSVSISTVKNLWASGALVDKVCANKQHTRKSSVAMIRDYQKRMMTTNPFRTWQRN